MLKASLLPSGISLHLCGLSAQWLRGSEHPALMFRAPECLPAPTGQCQEMFCCPLGHPEPNEASAHRPCGYPSALGNPYPSRLSDTQPALRAPSSPRGPVARVHTWPFLTLPPPCVPLLCVWEHEGSTRAADSFPASTELWGARDFKTSDRRSVCQAPASKWGFDRLWPGWHLPHGTPESLTPANSVTERTPNTGPGTVRAEKASGTCRCRTRGPGQEGSDLGSAFLQPQLPLLHASSSFLFSQHLAHM